MPAQAPAAFATLMPFVPQGNRVDLQPDRGSAELVWTGPSSLISAARCLGVSSPRTLTALGPSAFDFRRKLPRCLLAAQPNGL